MRIVNEIEALARERFVADLSEENPLQAARKKVCAEVGRRRLGRLQRSMLHDLERGMWARRLEWNLRGRARDYRTSYVRATERLLRLVEEEAKNWGLFLDEWLGPRGGICSARYRLCLAK